MSWRDSDTPWDSPGHRSSDSVEDLIKQLESMGFARLQIEKAIESTIGYNNIRNSDTTLNILIEAMSSETRTTGYSSEIPSSGYPSTDYSSTPSSQPGPSSTYNKYDVPSYTSESYSDTTTSETSQGDDRAVQIFRPEANSTSYSLDREQLERVFGQESVADLPVAVYSVAGAFRKGKSFMLNFFLHFLRAVTENKTESWLENKAKKLSKGFGWRGGLDRHTQGIWIWSEPFFLTTPEHGKVAVFLMDTQGAFDHENSVQGCSIIFALSTLISSVQIHNIMQQVQEDTLQHLQLFTEYGKAARRKQRKSSSHQEKPFQDLIFLVRDWPDPDVEYGFRGGEYALSKVLKVQRKHKDLESVRKNIHESFGKVRCFLMPSPGETIAYRGAQAPPPQLKDVNGKFLKLVDVFVRELFSPDKLVIKKVNGNIVTGANLINFTLAYCNVFESGEMPEVGTILEASAKAAILTTIQEGKNRYSKSMNEMSSEGYVEPNMLLDLHEQFKTEALNWYDEQPKLGEEKFIAKYRKNLAELIDQQFALHKQTNIAEGERMKNEIRDHVTDAESKFTTNLESFSNGEYVDEEALAAIAHESRNAAVEYFEEKTQKYDQKFILKYKEKLDELMRQAQQRFEETNRHRRANLIQILDGESMQALNTYTTAMDEKCKDVCLEEDQFINAHEEAMTIALDIFDTSDIGQGTEQREQKRKKLLTEIQREEQRNRTTNEINKKLAAAKTLETMNQAKDLYKTLMEDRCGDDYIDPRELDRAHDESKQQAEAIIMSVEQEKGKDFADKCRSQLKEFLDDVYKKLKAKNEKIKRKARNEFERRKNNAITNYKRRMDQQTEKYLEENQMKNLHEQSRSTALADYAGGNQEPREDFNHFKQELERDIDHHFMLVRTKNTETKKLLDEKAEKLLQDLKAEYLKHMHQLCDGKSVDPTLLNQEHWKVCNDVQQKLKMELEGEVAQKVASDFMVAANEEFTTICQNNKTNENTWMRNIMGSVVQAGLNAASSFFINAGHPKRALLATISGVASLLGGLTGSDKSVSDQTSAFSAKQFPWISLSKSSSVDPGNSKDSEKFLESDEKTDMPPPYTEKESSNSSPARQASLSTPSTEEMNDDPLD